MNEAGLKSMLHSDAVLERVSSNIWSVLPKEDQKASYDGMARTYDLIVGNSLYNKIMWGCWAKEYAARAKAAMDAADDGPILDCGCGSLIFTAEAYRSGPTHSLVLFDRSLGMMQRAARDRLATATYVQGDALVLPFKDAQFKTVMAWGLLHLFGSGSKLLAELSRVTAPGGRISMSTLVDTGRFPGHFMLRALQKRGEVAQIEGPARVKQAFAEWFDVEEEHQQGNMLMLRGRARGENVNDGSTDAAL
jgi:ubiquinone/menaquinone biosynthesis C-methylase UbiE